MKTKQTAQDSEKIKQDTFSYKTTKPGSGELFAYARRYYWRRRTKQVQVEGMVCHVCTASFYRHDITSSMLKSQPSDVKLSVSLSQTVHAGCTLQLKWPVGGDLKNIRWKPNGTAVEHAHQKLGNYIKGRPCNVKTIQWGTEFLTTLPDWVRLRKVSLWLQS